MATIRRFEDIEAWQKARELTRQIYAVSGREPFARDFGLRDQVRRSALSIMSNVAEGFERGGSKEFAQFLAIAKGSAGETASQLYAALDQGYIDQGQFDRLTALTMQTGRLIGGLMSYLRTSKIKGVKFK